MEVKRIIQVYEQLLAQNPAYRKKIGAFYTPEFIRHLSKINLIFVVKTAILCLI